MKIFNFGSINIDHIYQVAHFVQPGETLSSSAYRQVLGGKGANQSIALAKAGVEVLHLGRCSTQDKWVVELLASSGVSCELLELVEQPSGHAIIQVDDQAENAIVLFGGANQSFTPQDVASALSTAKVGDWLLLQNECSCVAEATNIAAELGLKVVLNPSPMLADIESFPLNKVSMLVVNEVEIAQLLAVDELAIEDIVEKVRTKFPQMDVVITLGAKGAIWVNSDELISVAAYEVDVVDTTAAGDTFLGYLMAAISRKESKESALIAGCKASSLAVQTLGASSSIPTAAQVAAI